MRPQTGMMTSETAPTRHSPYTRIDSIYCVPSIHGQFLFAGLVRQAFLELRPDAIAVEFPKTLEPSILKGVQRLPYLSVVSYDDYSDEMEKIRRIVPITPEDSLVEAVRLGVGFGVPVHFVDRDVLKYDPDPVQAPDPYIISRIGLERYLAEVRKHAPKRETGTLDEDREIEMADNLRTLSRRYKRVLFVCGIAHLDGIASHFKKGTAVAPGAVTQREHMLHNLSRESAPYALGEIPFYVYAYELYRVGLTRSDYPQVMPLPNTRGGEYEAAHDAYVETHGRLVEDVRQKPVGSESPDHYDLTADAVDGGVELYYREWEDRPSPSRLHILQRFARNFALVGRRLTPSKYQLLLSAKNCVNDDFAFQLLRLIDHYPFFEEDSDLPEMKMDEESGEADGEKLTLRLRLPRALQEEMEEDPLEFDEPAEEVEDGSWQERWEDGEHHVSHMPQDSRLESFFEYIRDKCRRILSDQQIRQHELQASLMDGLDLRETVRNLPLGKIIVREQLPGIGDVGPVVVIFHQPQEESQYPHQRMWFAEHAGESDLALYSTNPGSKLDGPGISRCQYGGVLSLYPPTGSAQVWGNPRYGDARDRSELLLKAAIDLSRKPIVAYCASHGPSAEMLSLAASRGIHILYVPLDTLSAETLKRVRTFHVLSDREVRPLAHMYIN